LIEPEARCPAPGELGERPVGRGTEEGVARSGRLFLSSISFGRTKEMDPRVQGRSHPQLAVEIAHKAREPFKTWTPAFAGATPVSSLSRG